MLYDVFPPGVELEYEPSIVSHDHLDADEARECPPDIVDVDEESTLEVASRIHVFGGIALDPVGNIRQEDVQDLYGGVLHEFQQSQVPAGVASEATTGTASKTARNRRASSGGKILYEFCCEQNSMLVQVGEENGVSVIRLCKEHIEQFCEQVSHTPLEC